MSVIGIDVDGVLASFEHGYAPLLTQVSGIEFPLLGSKEWPTTWFWEHEAGVSKEQETKVWKDLIIPSDDFWFNLPAHAGAEDFLNELAQLEISKPHSIYFITSRVGYNVKAQTEEWLAQHGFHDNATVLISSEKGECCHALKVNLYIDDKIENCQDVALRAPQTKCFMLSKPYNNIVDINGVTRVSTLEAFLQEVQDA